MTSPSGGTPPRRADQLYSPPPPAISPSSGDVVRAREVIIIGTGGLLLVYSPTAGTGDLIASIAGAAGTDQYGNTYVQGFGSYDPAHVSQAQLNAAGLTISDTFTGNAVEIGRDLNGQALVLLGEGNTSEPPVLLAAAPSQLTGQDGWHQVASGFPTGWAGTFQYAFLPFGPATAGAILPVYGAVGIRAEFTLSGSPTVADGTVLLTLPSGYQPDNLQTLPATGDGGLKAVTSGEGPQLRVNSSGQVMCYGVSTTATYLQVSALFWMGT